MKNIFFLLVFSCSIFSSLNADPIEIGATIPNFTIPLADQSGLINQEDLQGKITIIDFWATWCSPCITAMEHLESLKTQYPDQVQVLAVSRESFQRIQNFMAKRDFDFTFVVDSAEILNTFFPHRIIPHTVVIDQTGTVRAITEAGEINPGIIQSLLAKQTINLPVKAENTDFDYFADYFEVDTNTIRSFEVQPSIPGVGTFSKQSDNGPFANRRISLHNFMIDGMYRTAYQTSIYRMIYEVDEAQFDYENPNHKYCLDLIVAPEDTALLYPKLIQKLEETFPLNTRLEKRSIEVAVLYQIDSIIVDLPAGKAGEPRTARGDLFKDGEANFADLAHYLEDYGIVELAVLDETGDENHYQIDLSFSPEEKGSFQAALRTMGLGIKKVKREIEVLVLFEE